MENLSQRDKKIIWHPLTQHGLQDQMLGISKAKGALLYDEEGKSYIDGIASWYISMYGHCNPHILKRVNRQMEELDQVVFSGFTHEPAVALAEALLDILPENQAKIFYSDNGSTATEIGIKMAMQYFFNKGEKRPVLLALENGFHGDTFGAMSVSGLSVYNGPFEEYFLEVERIPVPDQDNISALLQQLEARLKKGDIGCFIYEPLVQGAAAMKMYPASALDKLLGLLHRHEVLTVADEVMTGFGKTGTNFASLQLQHSPDIICLSKALTAGLMPMAATSCTEEVFSAFYSDEIAKGFFHGHTYTANPLACAAALAGIELLRSEEIQQGIRSIIRAHQRFDHEMTNHPKVAATRQCGVIYALDLRMEMERYGTERDKLFRHFMDSGVFLRPLGNTIYILPPYIISEDQLQQIYGAIRSCLDFI